MNINTTNQKIPPGWEKTTLGEVMYPVSETFNLKDKENIHFLNTGDILEGKLLHTTFVPVSTLPGQAKKKFKKGDILFSEIRPANKRFILVNFDSSNSVASTKLMVLRAKDNIFTKYLYQLITSQEMINEFQFNAESRSGTFPQITFDSVSYFPIFLPPLEEQKEIAAILSSLDDKIELLRQQNKTLENMAQTLFKEWFVNFNFPDENGKPYKSSGGKTIDSDLGKIPDGWSIGKLSDLFTITMGQSPNGESYNESNDGIVFFQGRAEFGERCPSVRLFTTQPKRFAQKFDVLVSVRAPVGDINQALENCCIGRGLAAIHSDLRSFCYYTIKYLQPKIQTFEAEGTVFGSITKDAFNKIEVNIPSITIRKEFNDLISPVDQKIFNNFFQIQTLSNVRDTLLPKLIKGELRT